jgi:hypothetical protein
VSNLGSRYWRPSPPQRVVICQPRWTAMRSSRVNSRCPAASTHARSQRTRRVCALYSLVGLIRLIKALFLPLTPRAGIVSSWTGVTASVQLCVRRCFWLQRARGSQWPGACSARALLAAQARKPAKVTTSVPRTPPPCRVPHGPRDHVPPGRCQTWLAWPTVYVMAPLPPSRPAPASRIEDRQRFYFHGDFGKRIWQVPPARSSEHCTWQNAHMLQAVQTGRS